MRFEGLSGDSFCHDELAAFIASLNRLAPHVETGSIGQSLEGRDIFYLRLGNGPNQVFYNGAHHGLEWLTAKLLAVYSAKFIDALSKYQNIGGYSTKALWHYASIYIVPMVNPDGVQLVQKGPSPQSPYYNDQLAMNKGSCDFSKSWQANARGVDLNHNYDAGWQNGKDAEAVLKITGPGPTRYSGTAPESEPESAAVAAFTRRHDFRHVLAFHSQGREIFWNYLNLAPPKAYWIAKLLAETSGYHLASAEGMASWSGYKDWFISAFRRPGFTIEVGSGKNPLPHTAFESIYNENERLLTLAATL